MSQVLVLSPARLERLRATLRDPLQQRRRAAADASAVLWRSEAFAEDLEVQPPVLPRYAARRALRITAAVTVASLGAATSLVWAGCSALGCA